MSHNPLEAELAESKADLEDLHAERAEVAAALEWHSAFDRDAAARAAVKLKTKRRKLTAELAGTNGELETAKKQTSTLQAKTKWGTDPRYWFSQDRTQARGRLDAHTRRLGELATRQAELSEKQAQTNRQLKKARRAISRYDEFDLAAATAKLAALDADIPVREAEHAALADRKDALDRQLEGAVVSLEELRTELKRATSRLSSLRSDTDRWKRDVEKAKRLDKALSDAYDNSERYEIHQECEDEFDDGKPRRVMADRRRKLDEARKEIATLEQRIPGLERNVAKAEQRVATIVSRGTRNIEAIVIDGNNLCYSGKTFIGTAALRPLCAHLQESYDVTLVFDASIRRLLSGSGDERHAMTDERLRERFPDVTLHVVAARTQADETILAASVDPSVYVLSNDRFAEFRDKPAVRDRRVLTHEILNGRVLVHDLDISLTFAPTS